VARPEFDEYENEASVRCLALTTTTGKVWLGCMPSESAMYLKLEASAREGDDIDARTFER